MASYDIIGNIAIVKFKRGVKSGEKKKFASSLMKERRKVTTVLEKTNKFSGRLRTLSTKFIAGANTREAIYKENGCEFRFNTDSCYFSPRLAAERGEIAKMISRGEEVLVLFGGVAPFAIVIAKNSHAKKIVSVELGRECTKYALENVKRNKAKNVSIIGGDVRKVLPKMKDKFDRIVMSRPNLKDSFLDVTYPKIRKDGIIHYYGFCEVDKLDEMKNMVLAEAKKAKKKVRIVGVQKAGDIGVRKFRYRIDIKVLN